jgi:hypothetical protein
VAYTKLDVPTTFGDTHVIVSGTEGAPPVVLLHAVCRGGSTGSSRTSASGTDGSRMTADRIVPPWMPSL